MSRNIDPQGNHLIAALGEPERQRWSRDLEWVDMPLGQVLYEPGATMEYVYFPVTSIVSLLYVTAQGESSELAMVGNEGVVGVSLFMGGGSTPSRGVVQCAGQGFRMRSRALKASFDRDASVQLLMLRYTQSLITQMAQTAVCNRHHSLESQLCKRLLLSIDRLAGSAVMMTQELMASMMGVRREGVSVAAFRLQRAGLIRYSRGCIEVLDRSALEQRTCECYAVVKHECDRLLEDPSTRPVRPLYAVAPRRPIVALDDAVSPDARVADPVDRAAIAPLAAARASSSVPRIAFEAARQRRSTVDDRAAEPRAGVAAFVAMSAIVAGARSAAKALAH